jgi:P4 family phage/plasmid primase-like protien
MSDSTEHEAARFVRAMFGPTTQHGVFVTSLGNDKNGDERPRQVVTRDALHITRFCRKWDRAGRGLFVCVATLRANETRRAKETLSEIVGLHADIDLKSIDLTTGTVLEKLDQARLVPSFVVFSGGGLHAYWLFREAITVTPESIETVEAALHLLADLFGGDTSVCEVARLMRLPGTHNTKDGAWNEVRIVRENAAARYELEDLEEWLSETSPVILRKDSVAASKEENPFLAVASRFGYKPPIDVEQRLVAMSYQGAGETSIHQTQLQVSASLLSRGTSVDEVCALLSEATRAAAGAYGGRWNWTREDRAIRRMCEDWVKKNPERVSARAPVEAVKQAAGGSSAGAPVVHLKEERAKRAKPKKLDAQSVPALVADGVVETIRRAGQDIMLTEGEVWLYRDGIWHVMTPADQQWMLTLVQEGFEALGEPGKNAALATAWKRLTEHPGLFRRKVKWASADVIVCQNGVLEITSREFHAHAPGWFARRKIGTDYWPDAACPQFERLLDAMFADKPEQDRAGFAGVFREWVGSALAVSHLSREERKALILVGPSRTGKTEMSRIIRMLLGDPVATPSVAEISERFGLSSLYEAAAWIRDDAINEGDDLDPQRFKTIVTGEPIDIERKYRPAVPGVELQLPVLLTTNALPKARDKSDAIFNRSIVLEMTSVVSEDDAHRMRVDLGVPKGFTVGSHILGQEGPGVLNWALDGLTRLLQRGSYDLPEVVRSAVQRFKDDNNPVGEWARTAVVKSMNSRVSRADIMCAYHGWQREQDGDEARAFGARAFFPRLRAVAPWSSEMQEHSGRRYIVGVALTDEGLQLWDMHNQGPHLKGGSKGTSMTKNEVNKIAADLSPIAENGDLQEDPDAPRF